MWSKEYFRLHRMDQYLFLGNLRFVQLQAIYTSVLVTFRHPDDGRLLFSLSISLHCDNLANVLVAMSTVGLQLLMTCHAGRFYVFCNLLSWQFLVLFASSLLCLKPRVGLETKSKSSRIGIVFIARSEVWGACSAMYMWAVGCSSLAESLFSCTHPLSGSKLLSVATGRQYKLATQCPSSECTATSRFEAQSLNCVFLIIVHQDFVNIVLE